MKAFAEHRPIPGARRPRALHGENREAEPRRQDLRRLSAQRRDRECGRLFAARRPGAHVSTPLDWDELDSTDIRGLQRENILRLSSLKVDPWAGYDSVRQSITDAMRSASDLETGVRPRFFALLFF